jgi:hypothetical protein
MENDLLKLIMVVSAILFIQTFGYISGTTFLISLILLIIKSIMKKYK